MKAPRVELVYFTGCPHVDGARDALREALSAEGMQPKWVEWNRDDATIPETLRQYGSPTVLVDGHDVAPAPADANCCRLYPGDEGLRSAPEVDAIRAALKSDNADRKRGK
ncbi:MAG: thioredoxin family protein [Gammaproteobacteria bacterium]